MTETKMPELIMFVGIPGSGKSTKAREYEEKGYAVLSSDEVRAEVLAEIAAGSFVVPRNANLNSVVFDRIGTRAAALLKGGESVVLDATNLSRKRRILFKRAVYKIDCVKKCVLFIASPDVLYKRNNGRAGNARVPDEVMHKMLCSFECPYYWEGWTEISVVCDDTPFTFDFVAAKALSQDNPHHTLTVGEHMEAAANYAREHDFGERIEHVAAYHDIGKFYTKRFENYKGEHTETAHFYGHECYGAYLYLVEHCCGKNLTAEQFNDVLYNANLINCHMRPLRVWSDSPAAKARDEELFGERFFSDLLKVNECDKEAH